MSEIKTINFKCESCKIPKQKRKSFKLLGVIRSHTPLDLLFMDVCSIPEVPISGHRCFLSVTDDFSRKVIVNPLKSKDDIFDCFARFQMRVEQDGMNERFNYKNLVAMEEMLKDSDLSDNFWLEALLCYIYT